MGGVEGWDKQKRLGTGGAKQASYVRFQEGGVRQFKRSRRTNNFIVILRIGESKLPQKDKKVNDEIVKRI